MTPSVGLLFAALAGLSALLIAWTLLDCGRRWLSHFHHHRNRTIDPWL